MTGSNRSHYPIGVGASPFGDIGPILGEIETHILSRLKLARSPYIQVMKVSRNLGERRIEIDVLVDEAEVRLVSEIGDDPSGYYFDTWVEIPISELSTGQMEEVYRFLLVQGADYESRIFLDELPGGRESRLMMGRATHCLDGLEELLSEILREARALAQSLNERFNLCPIPGISIRELH